MKTTSFAIATSLYILPLAAHAVTIATEPFDYSNLDPTLSTIDGANDGGSGFTGPWSTPSGFGFGDVNLSADDTSLLYPAGTSLTSTGDRVRETTLTGSGGNNTANRPLTTTFDAGSDSTYYFSLLVNKVATSTGSSPFDLSIVEAHPETVPPSANFVFNVGVSSSNFPRIGVDPSNVAFAPAINSGETYMLLGKIQYHASGNDLFSLKVLRTATDTIPALEPAWDITHSQDVPGYLGTQLVLNISGADPMVNTQVDQIRFGTTYRSVAISDLPGDYNGDGIVDAADYVVWRKTNIDGPQGYIDWRANFGNPSPGGGASLGSAAVPEPATWALGLIAFLAFVFTSRRNAKLVASIY